MLAKDTEHYKNMHHLLPGEKQVPWSQVPIGTKVLTYRSRHGGGGRYIARTFRLEKKSDSFGLWWSTRGGLHQCVTRNGYKMGSEMESDDEVILERS